MVSSHGWDIPTGQIEEYLESCREFVSSDEKFEHFKRDPRYTRILEHSGYKYMGDKFYGKIKEKYPKLLDDYEIFKVNDSKGFPEIYEWDGLNTSVSTLRYVKTLGEIVENFGNLDGMKIVEIGGGYGGQCLTISRRYKFSDYIIYDLPDVCRLIEKYLEGSGVGQFETKCEVDPLEECDLIVSNYAFSECVPETQDRYFEIMKRSKRGFVTINAFSALSKRKNSDLILMFKKTFPDLIYRDEGYEYPSFVLSWGNA